MSEEVAAKTKARNKAIAPIRFASPKPPCEKVEITFHLNSRPEIRSPWQNARIANQIPN